MSMFNKKISGASKPVGLSLLVESIGTALDQQNRGTNAGVVARAALASESISSSDTTALAEAVKGLSASMEGIAHEYSQHIGAKKSAFTKAQIEAGVVAGAMSGDVSAYIGKEHALTAVASENMSVITPYGDHFNKLSLGAEAYDEKENRKAAQYSVAYNMQASRQDAFGEAFFPTVTITPDNIGFEIQARIVSVFNDFTRNVSGAVTNYNKQNIIRSAVDHTILQNELTSIVPVVNGSSVGNFVASGTIAPSVVVLGSDNITTAPLLFNNKIDLLGIGQTASLLANGAMDPTDSIDPGIFLKNIYVQFGAHDIIQFQTKNLPSASFSPAVQGNYRLMQLNFNSDSLLINKNTATLSGTALDDLVSIVTSDLILRVTANVSGRVNTETGETTLTGFGLSIYSLQDNTGTTIASTDARYTAIAAVFATATTTFLGYDLLAYRTNMNRRQRGQLLDTTFYRQLYPVALRSPLTALRPVTTDGQNDSSDLAALISATQIRASNEAVTKLLEGASVLAEYVDSRGAQTLGVAPDILGVGRLLVEPAYLSETVNMATIVDSLSSSGRPADIQAALVNLIRDMAYNLYRTSAYQPAANALAGGQAAAPTVIIGTDPVLARYLMVDGDLRTLGGEFECKIVSTIDSRVAGQIFVTFGQFDGSSDNAPNPLHFGNMAWKPEMTLVLPISRGGQVSKELTVQPSFLHILNLPVLGQITVTGVTNTVTAKVAVNNHPV